MYSSRLFFGIFSFLLFCCLLGCLLLPSPPQPVKRNGGGVGNLDQVQPDYTQCPHTGHKFGYIQENQHHRVWKYMKLDFLDILSECFSRRTGITWCFFAREFVWELWKHIGEQDERKLGWAFGSLRATTASDYLSLRERLNFLHNFAFLGSTHFLQIVKLGQFAVCTASLFAISCKYAIGIPQVLVPRCSTWKYFVCKLWQYQINSFANHSSRKRI